MYSTQPSETVDERLILSARQQFEAAVRRARNVGADPGSSDGTGGTRVAAGIAHGGIEGYLIIGEIHRGGQGVVYRGVHRGTRRDVAIKVLRGGRFASASERFRLEREARVLAQLRHPNVVTVFDSGVAAGHAYIVMDYIAGRPLDEFLRVSGGSLPIRERLRLLVTICDAVHAAHLRGITHRDLKPANIRVDENGQPHVLDFGLAKLTDPEFDASSEEAPMTQTGQFVGSLPWAAPEQAAGRTDTIDLRTDVYALGVILYQTLTGVFPYPLTGNAREMQHHILHTDPVRPRSVCSRIPGDAETIVLKCLQKEPERRYQTAGELARDLRRYLANEPIDARRDSLAYVLGKRFRRYKLAVAVVSAFVGVCVVGFVTSAILWQRAVADRNDARLARDGEVQQRQRAEENAERARAEAAKAEAVTTFLTEMLESSDPAEAPGRDVTVREVLDDAAARINDGALADEPEVLAQVQLTIGAAYESLGRYRDAERMIGPAQQLVTESLGPEHPLLRDARAQLAEVLFDQGRYAEAETAYADLLDEAGSDADAADSTVFQLVQGLGFSLVEQDKDQEAAEVLRPGLERAIEVLGTDDASTLEIADTLGIVERSLGNLAEARRLQQFALDGLRATLGDENPTTLAVMTNLGVTLRRQREYAEAEQWLRRACAGQLHVLGEEHPQTAVTLLNLSTVLWYSDQEDEAEGIARRVVGIYRRTLAPGHPKTLTAENNLARMLRDLRKLDELDALLAEMVNTRRRDLGFEHPETIRAVDYRRDILKALDRQEDLRAFVTDVLSRWHELAQQSAASPDVLIRYASLLLTCEPLDLRDPAAALETAHKAVALEESPDAYEVLSDAQFETGDVARAIESRYAALALVAPDDEHRRVLLEEGLADLLGKSGDLAGAETWLRQVLERRRDLAPQGGSDVEIALDLLGRLLLKRGKVTEAESVVRECLERRRSRLRAGHALVALTESLYGEVLTRQERFDEAEPLLLESHNRLLENPSATATRRAEARRRIVDLYEAWGRPGEAAKWCE